MMTIENTGYTASLQSSGYDKQFGGAPSPLLRVGTTITTSTNISSAAA
jgi:hypothetical protein